jgi:Bacterial alpha-L-rhamnosidase C-terminal domain/Bacterial alpha-L-rhamnosidase 6 hairpin glycosidase domain
MAPTSPLVKPLRILESSLGVRRPERLLNDGPVELVKLPGRPTPHIDIDFGRNLLGRLVITFGRTTTPAPQVSVAFSETRRYLSWRSDFSRDDNFGPGGRGVDEHVPKAAERWLDTLGCTTGGRVCADGLRGFRYVRIYLEGAPDDTSFENGRRSVWLKNVRVRYGGQLGSAAKYRGWFLSNSDRLNHLWYASVYTNELTTVRFSRATESPRETWTPTLAGKLVLNDGAKRDRAPWVDFDVQILTELVSHGRRAPIANVIGDLGGHQAPDGFIPPSPLLAYGTRFFEYPSWWAIDLADYVRYTGDRKLAQRMWPHLVRLFEVWEKKIADPDGLVVNTGANGTGYRDYTLERRLGRVAYYNALYILALRDAARIASWLGRPTYAERWIGSANSAARAVDNLLWDAAAQAYLDRDSAQCHSLDGNVLAVVSGLASRVRSKKLLNFVQRRLWRRWGSAAADTDGCVFAGSDGRVYPSINYWEVLARFAVDDDQTAIELLRRTWGWMLDHDPASTMWEAIGPGGTVETYYGREASMAHGWSAGAAPALTNFVLGINPTTPGFARVTIAPHPGSLRWAQGQVPTPHGSLRVAWVRGSRVDEMQLSVALPRGVRARVEVPAAKRPQVLVDGRPAATRPLADGRWLVSTAIEGRHLIRVMSR